MIFKACMWCILIKLWLYFADMKLKYACSNYDIVRDQKSDTQ